MQIICCRCNEQYPLELQKIEGSDSPVLVCPHCGFSHVLDFIPLEETSENKPKEKLEIFKLKDYFGTLTGSRIASATRVDQGSNDNDDIVDSYAACESASWTDYTEKFDSLGYVKIKVNT